MNSVMTEVSGFSKAMTRIYRNVYKIDEVAKTEKGKLFSDDNMGHFVVGAIFKKSDLMDRLRNRLLEMENSFLRSFELKLALLQTKNFEHFGVPNKFQLKPDR